MCQPCPPSIHIIDFSETSVPESLVRNKSQFKKLLTINEYKKDTVSTNADFWQARLSKCRPHCRCAIAAAAFYSAKSRQDL